MKGFVHHPKASQQRSPVGAQSIYVDEASSYHKIMGVLFLTGQVAKELPGVRLYCKRVLC